MMSFGRSDTYINVYLPREDGVDPRKYAQPSSPVFNSEEVYKFSDEIVKDRKLFLGKKQMSLYEIYYKDGKESGDNSIENDENSENIDETDDHDTVHEHRYRKSKIELPRVSKLSISLDNRIRRPKQTSLTRFNEPVYSYGTHKGYGNAKYNPNQSLERQVTSYNYMQLANRRRVTNDTIRNSRDKMQNISRLFKKAQSAPSEVRQVRSLGLPPVSRSNTSLTTLFPEITPNPSRAPTTASKIRPIRPSSKPHRVWQQTTNVFLSGYEPSTSMEPGIKQMKLSSSRSRHNVSAASDILV